MRSFLFLMFFRKTITNKKYNFTFILLFKYLPIDNNPYNANSHKCNQERNINYIVKAINIANLDTKKV